MGMDVAPIGDASISIRSRALLLPGVIASMATTSAVDAHRSAAVRADGNDDIVLSIPLQQLIVSDSGRELSIGPGEALITSLDRPVRLVSTGVANSFYSITLSRNVVEPLVPKLDDLLTGMPPAHGAGLQLLRGYVRMLLETPVLGPEAGAVVARQLAELVGLVVSPAKGGAADIARGGVAAARLVAAKRAIIAGMETPGLSVARVAAQLGVSTRYLHMLFEGEGQTFGEFLAEHRLQLAYRRLKEPGQRHRRIIDIALDAGFADVRTFNRAFRRRFQQTPTDARRR